ncbi:MAG: HsdM family class I SAM-dependent methyltransferase [Trueperaceae bacterium]
MLPAPKGHRAKALGAYYTNQTVADFLVLWAIRHAHDNVVDPSFGGGVFLEAAARRLETLGTNASGIYGVELDAEVHAQVSLELHTSLGLHPNQLLQADFFALTPKQLPKLDAVVGNPPFIRYQEFNTESRQRALAHVQKQGIALTKLASSWAAFVIHAASFLKEGGRLAMVIPAELGHAKYAKSVLKFLLESFGHITLLSFSEPLFPTLNQDTFLLFADNKGGCSGQFYVQELKNANALGDRRLCSEAKLQETGDRRKIFLPPSPFSLPSVSINGKKFLQQNYKLNFYQLPKKTRDLYEKLCNHKDFQRLGDVASVGIGYVTGANDYFHVSRQSANARKIPAEHLEPAVYKGSAFQGLRFTEQDWAQEKDAGYLFYPNTAKLSPVSKYIQHGESQKIQTAYKCRVRSPWYKVPHVYKADAFLTYMNGLHAQFVVNDAKVVAPNTLHLVRLHKTSSLSANDLAVLWQTSLVALSVELEGHIMGGGMLKLEPSEAKQILLPRLEKPIAKSLVNKLDKLLRVGKNEEANYIADKMVLEKLLGFTPSEIKSLRESAKQLRERRYYKNKHHME